MELPEELPAAEGGAEEAAAAGDDHEHQISFLKKREHEGRPHLCRNDDDDLLSISLSLSLCAAERRFLEQSRRERFPEPAAVIQWAPPRARVQAEAAPAGPAVDSKVIAALAMDVCVPFLTASTVINKELKIQNARNGHRPEVVYLLASEIPADPEAAQAASSHYRMAMNIPWEDQASAAGDYAGYEYSGHRAYDDFKHSVVNSAVPPPLDESHAGDEMESDELMELVHALPEAVKVRSLLAFMCSGLMHLRVYKYSH